MQLLIPETPRVNVLLRAITRFAFRLVRPVLQRRISKPRIEHVMGMPIYVTPDVLNPVVFRSGQWFAQWILNSAPDFIKSDFETDIHCLDLGSGSGVCSIAAASLGYKVCALDINSHAVHCTSISASINHYSESVTAIQSDLFDEVQGKHFDLIFFNPPFYRGKPKTEFDKAWRSEDVFERFAKQLKDHLLPGGTALLLLSTDGEPDHLLQLLNQQFYKIEITARKHFGTEIMTIYSVSQQQYETTN